VIYTQQGKSWKREVLEAGLSEGHTVLAADLDGDGAEEIVYGWFAKWSNPVASSLTSVPS